MIDARVSCEEVYTSPVSGEYLARLSVLENRIGAVEAFLGTADAARTVRAADAPSDPPKLGPASLSVRLEAVGPTARRAALTGPLAASIAGPDVRRSR